MMSNDEVSEESPHTGGRDSDLKSGAADALDVHGGYVLLIGGIALTVLACVFANRAAVAPIFAFSGASLFVLVDAS